MTSTRADKIAIREVKTLDSFLSYREAGEGPAVVFLHGNPASSYIWREVIPRVSEKARCLAPDLIGMGRSGKPDIDYRFADHARYLDAWFDALDLRSVVLVGHDWGGSLAMDWAARHPERVRGIVVMETFLRSMRWSDWPPQGAAMFRALRTPGEGERLVLEQNVFLERSLANGIKRPLSPEERAAYHEPFQDPKSRKPVLRWPREIPIEGEPADVVAVFDRYSAWMASSATPKLLLSVKGPNVLSAPSIMDWAGSAFASIEVVPVGPAGHHAPEDIPHEIGDAIAAWMARLP